MALEPQILGSAAGASTQGQGCCISVIGVWRCDCYCSCVYIGWTPCGFPTFDR